MLEYEENRLSLSSLPFNILYCTAYYDSVDQYLGLTSLILLHDGGRPKYTYPETSSEAVRQLNKSKLDYCILKKF